MPAYHPKTALHRAYRDMQALDSKTRKFLDAVANYLMMLEQQSVDTSFARTALYEAEWWIGSTGEVEQATAAIDRLLRALAFADPPDALEQDADGSFAPGATVFYIKLQRSTDQLLARSWPWRRPPSFLELINEPARMATYLLDRIWSDVVACGRDNRKELNEALSVITRLVVRGGQAGYLSAPNFYPVLARFIADWQDPETGFFGMTYILEHGRKLRTADLSLTFHMAHYVPHLVRWWPRLIDTLLEMRNEEYPEGWKQNGEMTDHNNYDVVELFARAWPYMRPDQRLTARGAVGDMLNWCLGQSVDAATGEVRRPDAGDPLANSYYFAAAFLNTVGIFDPAKGFWRDAPPPAGAAAAGMWLKAAMVKRLEALDPNNTMVDDALEQLGAKTRPWSNAML
jgi:hypothetical protein